MYSINSPPIIIQLEGITYKDVLRSQEVAHQLSIPGDDMFGSYVDDIEYEPIPKYFISPICWPTSTNISCYNCTLTINGSPIPVCNKIKQTCKSPKFMVEKIFCSFNCGYAYIINKYHNEQTRHLYINILKEIYYIFHGTRISVIHPSPDKSNLVYYGGTLNAKDYSMCIKALTDIDNFTEDTIRRFV